MFQGSFVALPTPFDRGKVDEPALRRLCREVIKKGSAGLVPTGTTGESPTLTHEEHRRVVEVVIEEAAGKVPVIAGAGSNCTTEAVSLSQHAAAVGATATLQIAPYYNKPDQRGLFAHFKTIGKKSGLPLVLYNHQGRTGITIAPETIAALNKEVKVAAVKDASGGIDYTAKVLDLTGGAVAVLSGNDGWTLPLMSLGASGVISVVANVAPRDMAGMCDAALKGDFKKARRLHYKLLPLIRAVELEVNPVPVKEALAMMGKMKSTLRSPLAPLAKENKAALRKQLKAYKLIK